MNYCPLTGYILARFSHKTGYPIGLDISDLSIKLTQLSKSKNKIKIKAIGKINLEKGIINNGEIINQEKTLEAIKKLISNLKFGNINSDEVVISLPETKTFIKLIKVHKTANPIFEIIESEMEKYIPMSIDEIYYDWQVVGDDVDKQLILISAAPKEMVDQYVALLNEVKLTVVGIEMEPVSLCRSLLNEELPGAQGQKNYAIVDIGAKRTSMTIYSKNTILFTTSLPISGAKITNAIVEALKIKEIEAEKAKIVCGLDESKAKGIIKNILSDNVNELINKIKDAFEFFNNNFYDRGNIDKILLCGGGANIKNLSDIIGKSIKIETKPGDALINLNEDKEKLSKFLIEKHTIDVDFIKNKDNKKIVKNKLTMTQDISLSFATSIGLALRGIFIDEI